MSEIEKMYENANVKKDWNSTPYGGIEEYYPPFTAEKQIELIKWLARKEMLCRLEDEYSYFERFEECIAYIINYLWQDLTEEEKASIKNILEM